MLNQLMILDKNEAVVAVLSNEFPDACTISSFRQIQEAQSGGSYLDTCVLTVPATHDDTQYLVEGNYILFRDSDGYWQEYRVMVCERQDTQTGSYIIATGENAFYELNNDKIDDIRPTDKTAAFAVIQALDGTRWEIGTAADLGTNSTTIYRCSVLAGLSQIASVWGGELRFRVEVVGDVITHRFVDILTSRGNVTGKRFEYTKDITSVVQTTNIQNLYTALTGRGKGIEIDEDSYGRRLEFDDIEWTVAGGDPANKPIGQNWIGDDTAATAYGVAGRHVHGFVIFETCTDAEELLQLTYDKLQITKVPEMTYQMSAIVLEELTGHDHEAFRFCDTVDIINNAVSPAITGTARIIYIDRDYINPDICTLTIGSYTPSLASTTQSIQSQLSDFSDRAQVWDRATAIDVNTTGLGSLEYTIDLLKTQLSSSVSNLYTDENGNLIIENVTQTAAIKLGAGIMALANTKTAGEYDWRTFATGSGYVADEMTTGTLNSAIIFTGTLMAASGTFTNLVAGVVGAQRMEQGSDANNDPYFKMYDNAGTLKITIMKDGIVFGASSKMVTYTVGDRTGVGIFVA